MSRLMNLSYALFDRARHPGAAEIAGRAPEAPDFQGLEGARQALVVTFKRSGEPVPTPVNCAISEDGRVYFRSEPETAKMRRIERQPRVLVGPCSLRGKPRGDLAAGTARILPAEESGPARELVARNWSLSMRPSEIAMDRLGLEMAYVEVSPR